MTLCSSKAKEILHKSCDVETKDDVSMTRKPKSQGRHATICTDLQQKDAMIYESLLHWQQFQTVRTGHDAQASSKSQAYI